MSAPRIAFLGLGTMGVRMAARLHASGLDVLSWNRSAARADAARARGLRVAPTIAEAVAGRELVVTILADPAAVLEVGLGPGGVAEHARAGALLVEMSTIDPPTVRQLAAGLAARGVSTIDVPVSGTTGPAERGELVLLAGGDAADLATAEPVLRVLGNRVVHAGPLGQGSALKLVINALGSYLCAGIVSSVVLGEKLGLDRRTMLDAIVGGPFSPPVLAAKAPRLLDGDYGHADFTLELLAKDQHLVARAAEQAGLRDEAHRAICALVDAAVAHGDGGLDLYGLVREVERRAR